MTEPIPLGKLPAEHLARLLANRGPLPSSVLLGPAIGEDAAAITIGDRVLVAAGDPITLTGRDAGRLAVIVNANDVAVTGAPPSWFLATVLVPPGTTAGDVDDLFASLRDGLTAVGASLVGGHTEVTAAVTQPVVAGVMLGLAQGDRLVRTGGMRPGDALVQVGPAPVEGAAVFAAEAGPRLAALEPAVLAAAAGAVDDPGISVVDAALLSARLGATAMHDPTEGGLAAGLHEMASASGYGIEVGALLWFEPGVTVCDALGADPMATLASGALLASFAPGSVDTAMDALRADGHVAAIVGEVVTGGGVRRRDGTAIAWPARDEVARVLSE